MNNAKAHNPATSQSVWFARKIQRRRAPTKANIHCHDSDARNTPAPKATACPAL